MQAVKQQRSWGVAEVILLLSIAILVIVVVVPVALIFFNAFFVNGQFNAADLVKTLGEGETYQALMNSLFIASGVTLCATAVGTFAWLVTRTDIPYKGFMKSMFLVPFMLPSFIGALAWKMLLSPRAGYINRLWRDMTRAEDALFNIFSYAGIICIETMYLFPFIVHSTGCAARWSAWIHA